VIPAAKRSLRQLSAKECGDILDRTLKCESVFEVERLMEEARAIGASASLLESQLILLKSESESKEEAIKEIMDALYIVGRTLDREWLEDAVWARENVYSTGLGFGFAIPHCKTDAVTADSIAMLKLKRPIDWGSIDGEPVNVVVLLAIRQSGGDVRHMQIFSKLARRLMDEEFRAHLLSLNEPKAVVEYLAKTLEISS
jgi:fructose-specific PTS system IIA-like component